MAATVAAYIKLLSISKTVSLLVYSYQLLAFKVTEYDEIMTSLVD